MCGIAGIVGLDSNEIICEKMLKSMKRRGPDAQGERIVGDCALLHSRLTIIDPVYGGQPMTLDWKGESYTIVYNGELYNTEQVRNRLRYLGHEFHGHSDTEVLLHAYAEWAYACVELLNGIFAFAVYEHGSHKLFVARDRMGVKPLFYKLHDGGIIFASEIKTILQYPTVKPQLDTTGIAQILMLGPGRLPGSGVLRDILELEPGCYGVYHQNEWMLQRYWKLIDGEHTESFEETAEQVRYLVKDAIIRQMVSDVPIGAFLSGGLDSSLICSVCSMHLKEQGRILQTFSVDYENNDKFFVPGKFQPNSDNNYIHIMSNYIGSDHYWSVLTADTLYESLIEAVDARDLPGMADVDSSLLAFCKNVRSHVKVALSGECADEIFGGYPWYRDRDIRAIDGFPWSQNIQQRSALLHPRFADSPDCMEIAREAYIQTIRDADIMPDISDTERRMKEMVNLNHRWFMQTLLDRKDRMSMYSGLEVRVPFCDYRIAEYLYKVPWEYKDYQGKEKGLLRYAMASYLPYEVLWRKKSPYPKTYDPKYEERVSSALKDLLTRNDAPVFQIIDKENAKKLLTEDYRWPWYGQLMRRPQTIAYILMINLWLERYKIDIIE